MKEIGYILVFVAGVILNEMCDNKLVFISGIMLITGTAFIFHG